VHSIAPGGAQLLYRCIRGYTPSSVRLLSFSPCDSYCGVTTARGTTHVFAVSPEGGAAGRSTHPADVAVTSLNSASTLAVVAAVAAPAAAAAATAAPLSIEPVCRVRTRRGSGDSPLTTNPTPPLAPTFTHSSAPASWSTGGGGLGYLQARAARGAHGGSSSSCSGEQHYSSSSGTSAFTAAAAAAAVPLATALRALPEGSSNGNANGRGNGSTVGVLTIGADCRLAESALVSTSGNSSSSYSSGMMAVHSGSAGSSGSSSSAGGQHSTAVEAVEKQFWSLQQAPGWGDVRAADSDAALHRMRSEGESVTASYSNTVCLSLPLPVIARTHLFVVRGGCVMQQCSAIAPTKRCRCSR
jgi:hypothetical protein